MRTNGSKSFTHKEQLEIARRIAWYWRDNEIVDYFKEKKGKKITQPAVWTYRNNENWTTFINNEREKYNASILEVPVANKRKRLDVLQKQFEAMEDRDSKDSRHETRQILKDAREEVEGRSGDVSLNFTQINHNEFHNMTDEDLQTEKMKTLEQLERVRKMRLLTIQGDPDGMEQQSSQEKQEVQEEK